MQPALAEFQMSADFAVYSPTGRVTLSQAIQKIIAAVAYAREMNVRKLLINGLAWEGYDSEMPTTLDRFELGNEIANASQSRVIVAFVTRAHMIDPEHFGAVVARNRGTLSRPFTSVEEAEAWLKSQV